MWRCPLSLSFLDLYAVDDSKGAKLVELWESLGSEGSWNFRFGRNFNDCEIDLVQNLLQLGLFKRLDPRYDDRLCWKKSKDSIFSRVQF